MHAFHNRACRAGMTLLELLIVIAILGVLMGLLIPTMGKMVEIAGAQKLTQHLKQISVATTAWGSDNGNRIPSPVYPGGMNVPTGIDPEDYFPDHWDFTGSGLWLDGVVFGAIYLKDEKAEADYGAVAGENGEHLKGTIFENTQSIKQDPKERDWHKHSYAMNANLQYDRIYDNIDSADPYLTEKTLSNLIFAPNAMLFIECTEPNVVMHSDREAIVQTIEEHWGPGGKAIVTYLDGHSDRVPASEIPAASPDTDRESSRFWRGVDP